MGETNRERAQALLPKLRKYRIYTGDPYLPEDVDAVTAALDAAEKRGRAQGFRAAQGYMVSASKQHAHDIPVVTCRKTRRELKARLNETTGWAARFGDQATLIEKEARGVTSDHDTETDAPRNR
jgi:hypothetical protein